MPPVKKPKPQKSQKTSPAKKPVQTEKVISGQLEKKLQKGKPAAKQLPERGVIFIKHLPHGFFEEQLRKYFQQFGRVTRLRLARSQRTGGSKGFAFVEFEYPEVAKVAADTMDNYLMFQKVVKAAYIPPSEQKFNYFKTSLQKVKNKAGKEIWVSSKTKAAQRSVNMQNNWNEAACQKRTDLALTKLQKMQEKYKDLGINFSSLLVQPVKKGKDAKAATPAKSDEVAAKKTKIDGTVAKVKKSKQNAANKKPDLLDLLGDTINEDSEDEDYAANAESAESEDDLEFEDSDDDGDDDDDEETPQLEDLLGNTLSDKSDDEDYEDESASEDSEEEMQTDDSVDSEDEEQEDESPAPTPVKKKLQKQSKGVDRLDELLKRKPGTGGVQKKKNVVAAKASKKPAKQTLQLAAAKQLAQPLQKFKSKKLKK